MMLFSAPMTAVPPDSLRLKKQRAVIGKGERERDGDARRAGEREAGDVLRIGVVALDEVDAESAEFGRGREVRGGSPSLDEGRGPIGEMLRGGGVHRVDGVEVRIDLAGPILLELRPLRVLGGGEVGDLGGVRVGELYFARVSVGLDLREPLGALPLDAVETRDEKVVVPLQRPWDLRLKLPPRLVFKLPADIVRAFPLRLDRLGCFATLVLHTLPLLRVSRLRGGRTPRAQFPRIRQRGRDARRRSLCLPQADTVGGEKQCEHRDHRAARHRQSSRISSEKNREHPARDDDQQDQDNERHVAEATRQSEAAKRGELRVRIGDPGLKRAEHFHEIIRHRLHPGGRLAQQLPERTVSAEKLARVALQVLEFLLLFAEPRSEIGGVRIRSLQARIAAALRVKAPHLQLALPATLLILGALRQAAQPGRAKLLDPCAPPLVNRMHPLVFRFEMRLRLRGLHRQPRVRLLHAVAMLPIRRATPAEEFAREHLLLLREIGDGVLERQQQIDAPADTQIDATHNRSAPFSKPRRSPPSPPASG